MAAIDAGLGDEACDGSDVEEPLKDCAAAVGQVQEGEEPEARGECNGGVRDTLLAGSFKELRGATLLSET